MLPGSASPATDEEPFPRGGVALIGYENAVNLDQALEEYDRKMTMPGSKSRMRLLAYPTRRAISRAAPGMTYVKLTAEIVDWTTRGHRVDTHNSARAQWIAGCWLSVLVVLLLPFSVEMRPLLSSYEPRLLPSRLQQRSLLQPTRSERQRGHLTAFDGMDVARCSTERKTKRPVPQMQHKTSKAPGKFTVALC